MSRCSTEAEYKALANASAELIRLQQLLLELGIKSSQVPRLFCDNTGVTYLSANPVFHSRMKHIALDYHFILEQVQNNALRVHHINTKEQIADILTKPISRHQFEFLRSKIEVTNGDSILRGCVKTITGSDKSIRLTSQTNGILANYPISDMVEEDRSCIVVEDKF